MNKDFNEFFKIFFKTATDCMDKFGCFEAKNGEGAVVCASSKFIKGIMTYCLIKAAGEISPNDYVYASQKMISDIFDGIDEKFFVRVGKSKKQKCINALLAKHFSVIFREISKCFPSRLIFIGNQVGTKDFAVYAKQQFLEGKPVDVRRLKKIKEKEQITEKEGGQEDETR